MGLDSYNDYILTCSDDAKVRCQIISKKQLLFCASLNVGPDKIPYNKDKRTKEKIQRPMKKDSLLRGIKINSKGINNNKNS